MNENVDFHKNNEIMETLRIRWEADMGYIGLFGGVCGGFFVRLCLIFKMMWLAFNDLDRYVHTHAEKEKYYLVNK